MGFFMLSVLNVISLFANSLTVWLKVTSLVFIVVLAGYLSKIVMEIRLK